MESTVWYEKYKPQTLDDVVLPDSIKQRLRKFIDTGTLPNLGFWSSEPGLGKSSTAHAIVMEMQKLGHEAMWINASLEKGIDTLRGKINTFAVSASVDGLYKVVVLDECDYLSADFQAACRGFLDNYSSNCRFILTGNYKNKIIEPLLDRITNIDFAAFDRKDIAKPMAERLVKILKNEGVDYNKEDLIKIIYTYYPRMRSMIAFLQRSSTSGTLVVDDTLDSMGEFDDIINACSRPYNELVSKVNTLTSPDNMYSFLYKNVEQYFGSNAPKVIITIARYQHMASTVRDKHLNLMACLTEIRSEVKHG